MKDKIQVLLADDHAIVRDGVRQLLATRNDMEIVGEAVDGCEVMEKIKLLRPDVVLLDIAMPSLSGLDVLGLIRETMPDIKVVVLSMHDKENYIQQVLALGALGYVLKASPSSDIVKAIKSAYRGEYFLSSKLKTNVIHSYVKNFESKPSLKSYDLLSEREQQVFRLVVQGNSTKQIASLLCVSPKTVEKHRASIMEKLGVHDRLELLKYAIKIGVVDPELWVD